MESLHYVGEQELLGALVRSIRFGALHALERAATFGRARAKVAVWTNDAVDVRCLRPENEVESVRIGTSPLPTGAKSIGGELELGDVQISERAASHAAWFLMNDLYQSELGAPISTIMGYDGRYRLGELDDCGLSLRPVETSDAHNDLWDLNDEVFATVVRSSELSHTVRVGTSEHPAGDFANATRVAQQLLRSERHRMSRGR